MIQLVMIVLFILPLVFQIIVGTKAIRHSISLSFWKVSLISLLIQLITTLGNLWLMGVLIRKSASREGLALIGVLAIELVAASVLLVVILIQGYILYRKKRLPAD
ncbi:MAG: hypothetical protein JNL03_02230 [Prolixibacteraceae bacterium]|nr:hypothetical protein [Prolixibacteraceae bacterium]